MKQIQIIPNNAYPVLFWYTREWLFGNTAARQMQIELNENIIYKN